MNLLTQSIQKGYSGFVVSNYFKNINEIFQLEIKKQNFISTEILKDETTYYIKKLIPLNVNQCHLFELDCKVYK